MGSLVRLSLCPCLHTVFVIAYFDQTDGNICDLSSSRSELNIFSVEEVFRLLYIASHFHEHIPHEAQPLDMHLHGWDPVSTTSFPLLLLHTHCTEDVACTVAETDAYLTLYTSFSFLPGWDTSLLHTVCAKGVVAADCIQVYA